MKKTGIIIACAVLAAASFTGCKKPDGGKGKGDVEAVFAVNAYKVAPTNLDDYLEFGGDVDASSSVAVTSFLSSNVSPSTKVLSTAFIIGNLFSTVAG